MQHINFRIRPRYHICLLQAHLNEIDFTSPPQVKDLDAVRGRVGNVTKRVNDILDVKNCIEGVQRAMEKEDYEEAASYIQR